MKIMLEKIVQECANYGIPVEVDLASDGSIAYIVSGFSKSGQAKLSVSKSSVVCETRYNRVDHILTFHDLAYIAYEWYENYKDRSPFEQPESYWSTVFKDLRIGQKMQEERGKDLPF
jgi:hypothetical protein